MTLISVERAQQIDPFDFIKAFARLGLFRSVTFASATVTLGTVPANSLITRVYVGRTTKWDAVTTFQIGKSGDTDWLATTVDSNVTGAIQSGEAGAVEAIEVNKIVSANTDVILTLNQGAAAAGVGFVSVEFQELDR